MDGCAITLVGGLPVAIVCRTGETDFKIWRWFANAWSAATVKTGYNAANAKVVYDPVRSRFVITTSGSGNSDRSFYSTDGVTWVEGQDPGQGDPHQGLVVHPVTGRVIRVFAGGGGTFLGSWSDDGGVTWTLGALQTPAFAVTWDGGSEFSIGDDGTIYAALVTATGSTMIWRSTDGGGTFV